MQRKFTNYFKNTFLGLITLLSVQIASAQDVVIQEVLYNPAAGVSEKIALKNVSAGTIDVSNWCICNVPSYRTINNATTFNILSGDPAALKAGEVLILELTGSGMVLSNAAEIALYHTNGCGGYTTASNMEDFVSWGSASGSTRGSVAENANLWNNGNYVPVAAQGEIMQFDGTNGGTGNITLVSDFTNVTNGVLPVEFIDFSAQKVAEAVKLTWSTASETNSDYFAIGKSSNGMQYEEIARLPAAGFSTTKQYYEYIDRSVEPGKIIYYRLEQVDLDGKMSYSSIEVIGRDENAYIATKISPNPIRNSECLFIELASDLKYEAMEVRIQDYLGKTLHQKRYAGLADTAYQIAMDFPFLNNGFYLVSLYADGILLESVPMVVTD